MKMPLTGCRHTLITKAEQWKLRFSFFRGQCEAKAKTPTRPDEGQWVVCLRVFQLKKVFQSKETNHCPVGRVIVFF